MEEYKVIKFVKRIGRNNIWLKGQDTAYIKPANRELNTCWWTSISGANQTSQLRDWKGVWPTLYNAVEEIPAEAIEVFRLHNLDNLEFKVISNPVF